MSIALSTANHVKTEPLFLSCAEIDHTFDQPSRRKALEILQDEKKTWQLQLFSGVQHGFALRGDPKDPHQRLSLHEWNYGRRVTDN